MEVRILQIEELANAAGLSRYVFDACLRSRMEYVQTVSFVEQYLTEENLKQLSIEKKLMVWGAFEQNQLIGVGGLQSDGMITMLYVLPQFNGRGLGNALLISMREYAKDMLGLEKVIVNAAPAWTASYFLRQGFSYVNPKQNMHVPFVPLYAMSNNLSVFQKRKIPGKVIAIAIVGCVLFTTAAGILSMISFCF